MSPKERIDQASDLARQAFLQLRAWQEEPDPVEQRRLQQRAAVLYRHAADVLDDSGRVMA